MLLPVETRHIYLLMNHGPVTLITSAHDGARNVMAASWVMPLDFDPARVVAVIDKSTRTRQLIDRSGVFGVNLPTRAITAQALTAGHVSALAAEPDTLHDKIDALGLKSFPARRLELPLIEGCAAWLECRVLPERRIETAYDLFVAEVVAAWSDARCFANGRWLGGEAAEPRPATLHYVAGGQFFESGPLFEVEQVPLRTHPDDPREQGRD
jgi:flavin reductase (DIM6/NTAB) family NADH-FMN oxidoreductase RutF